MQEHLYIKHYPYLTTFISSFSDFEFFYLTKFEDNDAFMQEWFKLSQAELKNGVICFIIK